MYAMKFRRECYNRIGWNSRQSLQKLFFLIEHMYDVYVQTGSNQRCMLSKKFMHVVTNISHKLYSFNCSENVLYEVNCNIRFLFVPDLEKT